MRGSPPEGAAWAEKVYLPYIAENVSPEQIDGDDWEELERYTRGL